MIYSELADMCSRTDKILQNIKALLTGASNPCGMSFKTEDKLTRLKPTNLSGVRLNKYIMIYGIKHSQTFIILI